MKKLSIVILFLVFFSCTSTNTEGEERPGSWLGNWKAQWDTPPESYPDIVDMEFFMDGNFTFSKDSLTVVNNGYPGCIFAVDTLSHTQLWKISNDTLVTYNDPKTPGMTYKIVSFQDDEIKLQLMNDIFILLKK